MSFEVIRQFKATLSNLDALLDKAQAYAEAHKFSVDNFMTERLAPDMLPFAVQVRIACDTAKGTAATLAGVEAPRHADDETTVADLRGRIGKCVAYLETFKAEDFAGKAPDRVVKVTYPPGKGMYASEYLYARQIPNFFFHVTTAYALLRRGGMPIGKGDYLGDLTIIDL